MYLLTIRNGDQSALHICGIFYSNATDYNRLKVYYRYLSTPLINEQIYLVTTSYHYKLINDQ